mgnify:CR=1 FL=1
MPRNCFAEETPIDAVGGIEPKISAVLQPILPPFVGCLGGGATPQPGASTCIFVVGQAPVGFAAVGIRNQLPGLPHTGVHIPLAVVGRTPAGGVMQPTFVVVLIHVKYDIQLVQAVDAVCLLAFFLGVGQCRQSMAARIAMMAMTTSNSIRVNPLIPLNPFFVFICL